jgi:hypothetical protein
MKPWYFISKKQKVIKPEVYKIDTPTKAYSRRLRHWSFLDLGLMHDALQKQSELRLDLQHRDIDLY